MNPSKHVSALTVTARPAGLLALAPAALLSALLLGPPSATAVTYSPPANGLVAWWSAEGNANDHVAGHNGTLSGAVSYIPGPIGQAFSVGDGAIYVPDGPAFALTGSLSIGLWIKPTPDSWLAFFRGDARPGFDPYAISMARDGTARIGLQLTDAGNNVALLFAPIAGYDQWQQVTATFDAGAGRMRVYINGTLMAEDTTTIRPFGTLDPGASPGVSIGNATAPYDFPFQGGIDEVVLYSRALSPAEVASLVPEPSTGALLAVAFAGFCARRKETRK